MTEKGDFEYMFLVMLLAFFLGIVCFVTAIKECCKKGITSKNIVIAVGGIVLISLAIYMALPHYS